MTEDRRKDSYANGKRDARLTALEQDMADLKPRQSRTDRIVYGALAIFGFITYWPTLQKFLNMGSGSE